MKEKKSKVIMIRMTPETYANLVEAAKADDRPVSTMARRLILTGLELKKMQEQQRLKMEQHR